MSVIKFAFCWLYILQYTGSEVNFDTGNLDNDCLLFLVSEVKSLALPSSLDQYSSQQHFDENQIIIPGLKVIRMSKCIGIQILPMNQLERENPTREPHLNKTQNNPPESLLLGLCCFWKLKLNGTCNYILIQGLNKYSYIFSRIEQKWSVLGLERGGF